MDSDRNINIKKCVKFEPLAVTVMVIQNLQRAITQQKIKFPPGYLLIIIYKLSKFEAPSCNGF